MHAPSTAFTLGLICILGCAAEVAGQGQGPFHGDPDLKVAGVRRATGLSAGDFNVDGRPDLVVLSGETGKMAVLLNRGGKSFEPAASVSVDVGTSASALTLGDFNEDGRPDAAICHHDTDEVWVLLGKGDGTFQPPRKFIVPVTKPHAHRIMSADFNGDKHLDLLLAESDDNRAWALLGDGTGNFRPSPESPVPTGKHPYVVATGDFDRDGSLDFATPNWFDKSVTAFMGNGRGGFQQIAGGPITGFTAPTALAAGDLTGDGKLDLVVGNNGERGLQILVGNGKGGFKAGAVPDLEPRGACFDPVLADLNRDGRLDVVATATNGADTFSYWLNQGSGTFSKAIALPCVADANTVSVADLNGDGIPDLAVGTWDGDKTLIWFGKKSQPR